MRGWVLLAFCCWNFSGGFATICMRVVGGTVTTIENYPTASSVLLIGRTRTIQICGGTIINERHILTAAHCFMMSIFIIPSQYLIRVGSTMAHSGGTTHRINSVMVHPKWNKITIDCDVAIMRTVTTITYSKSVQPARIAESTYKLYDNESVWAVGWGLTSENGNPSEQLRHVKILTINTDVCRSRFKEYLTITENMLCTGMLDRGGRDQCTRDSGSPVYHHNTVVGFSSMGFGCARACYPGVNVRVSRFSNWIKAITKVKKYYKPTPPSPKPIQGPPHMGIIFAMRFNSLKEK